MNPLDIEKIHVMMDSIEFGFDSETKGKRYDSPGWRVRLKDYLTYREKIKEYSFYQNYAKNIDRAYLIDV